jgi:hypothetical protein
MVMAIILPHQNASRGDARPHTPWLYRQQPFAAKVQKLLIKSAYHGTKAGKTTWSGEVQTSPFQENLNLSC